MIPINSTTVYDAALTILKSVVGHGFRGRAAQIRGRTCRITPESSLMRSCRCPSSPIFVSPHE